MISINEVTVCGNLTRDPELKALPSGSSVANISVATNRVYKDASGQKQEQVEYHNIVAFGKTADTIAQYFSKGRQIYVRGRLQTRSWEGEDGKTRYRTEIILTEFQFGNNPNDGQSSNSGYGGYGQQSQSRSRNNSRDNNDDAFANIEYGDDDVNPDDIPF